MSETSGICVFAICRYTKSSKIFQARVRDDADFLAFLIVQAFVMLQDPQKQTLDVWPAKLIKRKRRLFSFDGWWCRDASIWGLPHRRGKHRRFRQLPNWILCRHGNKIMPVEMAPREH